MKGVVGKVIRVMVKGKRDERMVELGKGNIIFVLVVRKFLDL